MNYHFTEKLRSPVADWSYKNIIGCSHKTDYEQGNHDDIYCLELFSFGKSYVCACFLEPVSGFLVYTGLERGFFVYTGLLKGRQIFCTN
ncbi:unnamed protein product [Rhizophagus irregularis]|nr:unnamed protein product [Rhizophagus irregularis]CAB4431956.1 unnamed protein product [Rhizophagus irregularis]